MKVFTLMKIVRFVGKKHDSDFDHKNRHSASGVDLTLTSLHAAYYFFTKSISAI